MWPPGRGPGKARGRSQAGRGWRGGGCGTCGCVCGVCTPAELEQDTASFPPLTSSPRPFGLQGQVQLHGNRERVWPGKGRLLGSQKLTLQPSFLAIIIGLWCWCLLKQGLGLFTPQILRAQGPCHTGFLRGLLPPSPPLPQARRSGRKLRERVLKASSCPPSPSLSPRFMFSLCGSWDGSGVQTGCINTHPKGMRERDTGHTGDKDRLGPQEQATEPAGH